MRKCRVLDQVQVLGCVKWQICLEGKELEIMPAL
jgi:hypothetical protein